ncbi:hypothetical protein DFH11DRAFT_1731780 [Phellopilus nigrolimitatus]|nr:hypothetical protein DFH11DRAFT_1731780 [Phellopilus nigrolimitatus]
MLVSSAIIHPTDKQAYSGGGNWVERITASLDGGHIWYAIAKENLTNKHYFAWRLWHFELSVDAVGWLEFCVRTGTCRTTPSRRSWNLHATSSCYRIKLYSVNHMRTQTAARLQLLAAHSASILDPSKPFEATLDDEKAYFAREPLSQTRDGARCGRMWAGISPGLSHRARFS